MTYVQRTSFRENKITSGPLYLFSFYVSFQITEIEMSMMTELFANKRIQGDRVVKMLLKSKFQQSVNDNDTLSMMMNEKSIKDLKKGDRIVLPAMAIFSDGDEEIKIDDGDLMAEEGTDCGFVVLDVKLVSVKTKVISVTATLTSVEVSTGSTEEDWESRSGFSIGEEMQLAFPEVKKTNKLHVLDDAVPRTETKKAKALPIGKKQLQLFGEMESSTEDSKGENLRRRRDIRKTLSFLRKTDEALHPEVVLTEGGLKQNSWYLERIEAASHDHLGRTGGITKAEDKWEGISEFQRISKLRLLRNKEAFQDFAVHGIWDESKYGRLLDQFLTENETVNDRDGEQLTRILHNKQTVLKIVHGSTWNKSMGEIINKLENGQLGRTNPAQIKNVIEETWEACNRILREDENTLTQTVTGITKSYSLDDIESVVEMVTDRFNGIPETTYETEVYFQSLLSDRRIKKKESDAQLAGNKRKTEDNKWESGSSGQAKEKSRRGIDRRESTDSAPQKVEYVRTDKKKANGSEELLCLFDLKQKLLNTSKGCVKGSLCDRQHVDLKRVGKQDYYWTAERLSVEVSRTKSSKVINANEKTNLERAIKDLA